MSNKTKIVSIFTIFLMTGSMFAVSKPAYAANGGFWGGNFFSGFVSFMAQKFNLDKTQVQNALNDYQKQQKATITPRPTMSRQDRQAMEKKRLDIFVSQGKITSDQENAIISELETLRTKYNLGAQNNLTPEERKTQMDNMQNELKTWAKSQGIDSSYILPMGKGGRGFGWDKGENGNSHRGRFGSNPSPTQ
jgi:hypothetical protein